MAKYTPSSFVPILTLGIIAAFSLGGCDTRTRENAAQDTVPTPSESSTLVKPVDKLAAIPVLVKYEGTYPISEVFEGSHKRKNVKIDPDGSIDFDELIYLGKKNYTVAEDTRATNGCVTVQLKGQQEGQIARLDILFDANSKAPVSMRYMPTLSSPEGLVEVEF